jgi:hypothetical protein
MAAGACDAGHPHGRRGLGSRQGPGGHGGLWPSAITTPPAPTTYSLPVWHGSHGTTAAVGMTPAGTAAAGIAADGGIPGTITGATPGGGIETEGGASCCGWGYTGGASGGA